MYSNRPNFVFGFHGTDEKTAAEIINGKTTLSYSKNDYDWLGEGVYFWENNFERASQFAHKECKRNPAKIAKPFVLGAALDLGRCLDLLDQKYLDLLKIAYESVKLFHKQNKITMPKNTGFSKNDFDFKKRELDCQVIRCAHTLALDQGLHFDSVRAAFWEGNELYKGAGFREQNHIQIAILNNDCIKGIFIPREKTSKSS